MTLTLDNDSIRAFIPNIIHEVRGETTLYDKMLPWLTSAQIYLEDNFVGRECQPATAVTLLATKIVVYRAFAEAVPSLDLSVSPGSFTVISTEGRAPASKERVDRLVASLNSFCDANLPVLIKELAKDAGWRESIVGKWWMATFIPNLDHVARFRADKDLMTTYRMMRSLAGVFEQELAERYFGQAYLDRLRGVYPEGSPAQNEVREAIISAELQFIQNHIGEKTLPCPNPHEIWHLCRPVLSIIQYLPSEKQQCSPVYPEDFKNNVKGGYFF